MGEPQNPPRDSVTPTQSPSNAESRPAAEIIHGEPSAPSNDPQQRDVRKVIDATPMARMPEVITAPIGPEVESMGYPSIQIAEEASGINIFAPYRV